MTWNAETHDFSLSWNQSHNTHMQHLTLL